MAPKLYVTISSPPCRAVFLTAKALGVNFEVEEIDLAHQEQFKPSFIKINPQHTIPTLEDDDFVIWDSHVISGYLVDKFGGFDDSLYPTDLNDRAKVNQKLFFDTELQTLSARIFNGILRGGKKSAPEEDVEEIHKRYEILNKFLSLSPWVAGDNITIGDLCLIATVSSINILVPFDDKKYPKLAAWFKKCQALPYYPANKSGLDKLQNSIAAALEG